MDLDWKDTSGMTVVVDPALVSALSDAVGQIPGMPSVSFSSMVLAYSEQEKECCSDGEIKKIKCASGIGAIGASIQRVSLWSVDESYRLEWLGFGVKLTIEAEAYIEGTVGATCSIGKYENECTEESCNFGKISAIAGIEIGTSCWVEGCVILFGHDLCMNFGAELSAAIEFEGSVRLNKCGSCDGLEGSFSLKTLKLKLRFWSDGQSDEDEINLLE